MYILPLAEFCDALNLCWLITVLFFLLGEQLYPKILPFNPELAGKITGMLLEMEIQEVVNMLESPDLLKSKVDEAQAVLAAHREKAVKEWREDCGLWTHVHPPNASPAPL